MKNAVEKYRKWIRNSREGKFSSLISKYRCNACYIFFDNPIILSDNETKGCPNCNNDDITKNEEYKEE